MEGKSLGAAKGRGRGLRRVGGDGRLPDTDGKRRFEPPLFE